MRTLLLADDSVTTQRVIALMFADEPFRVVTVSDGQQAMDTMAVMRPDIVLASNTLPRTNGYELAEYIRSVDTLRDVPVLLLSGAFESVDEARLTSSGARGILEKPLEPTAVINRVRELLGLKDTRPAPLAGRMVTSADTPSDHKAPPAAHKTLPGANPVAVSPWDDLPKVAGLAPDARSVEGEAPGASREDYLGTLDHAFDSLDQQLAGGHHDPQSPHRNPSPPLGQAHGSADPRSPGRRPPHTSDGPAPNSVFEVDTEWFADDRKAADTAARNEMVADARESLPARPDSDSVNPIFEVDDEWFAEDNKAREERRAHHRDLTVEMGVHDVELPDAEPVPNTPAPADGLDFDFGLDNLPPTGQSKGPALDSPLAAPPLAAAPFAPAPLASVPTALAPSPLARRTFAPTSVADDFAALLAFETGDAEAQEEPAPLAPAVAPPAAPVVLQAPAPEITDAMLDTIAQRVADRLNSGTFGADLRDAMTTTVRETVRSVVSETSERLVRDEIARVKARAERDTQ